MQVRRARKILSVYTQFPGDNDFLNMGGFSARLVGPRWSAVRYRESGEYIYIFLSSCFGPMGYTLRPSDPSSDENP